MSLQKGKLVRRVQPWTASNNWFGDSRPPARLFVVGTMLYGSATIEINRSDISDLYTYDPGDQTFQWVNDFAIPFFDFGFRTRITPQLNGRYVLLNLFITDFSGGTLEAGYAIDPFTFEWSYAGDFLPTRPAFVHVTGPFQDIILLGYQGARYDEEP